MKRKTKQKCAVVRRGARAVLGLALSAFLALGGTGKLPARAEEQGIDVSRYQGAIDWEQVAASGVTFAFVRAGTSYGRDSKLEANLTGAQEVGIRTGVYIYSYAHNVEEVLQDADRILEWIEPYTVNLPVALDIEEGFQRDMDADTITAMCNAFCERVENAGYYPITYSYRNFIQNHITENYRYDLWVAAWGTQSAGYPCAVWQYSSSGSVAGISGRVDQDVMYANYPAIILEEGFLSRNGYVTFFRNYRTQTGWIEYQGKKYHMNAARRQDTDWYRDSTGWYYLNPGDGRSIAGSAISGLLESGGEWYYFNGDGVSQSGFVTLGDFTYYFDGGNWNRMSHGWMELPQGRYYFDPADGHMLTGVFAENGRKYYFGEDGRMRTGVVELDGKRYYYDPVTGARTTGLVGTLPNRYFADPMNEELVTGFWRVDESIYYFGADGRMLTGRQEIGGEEYLFDEATGALVW